MPGLRSVGNVTLKKGVFTQDSIFWKWYDESLLNIKRRPGVISQLDESHAEETGAPKRMAHQDAGRDLKSNSNEVAIESRLPTRQS